MKMTLFDKWISFAGTRLVSCLNLCLVCVVIAGCSAKNEPQPEVRTDGKIIIKGSHTIGEELAPKLIAEYKKEHPSAAFELEAIATGYGLASLIGGKCDIAGASREALQGEVERAQGLGVDLKDDIIGFYGVAVIVNSNSPVTNLTKPQVRDIFTGAIKNWKDVGGPDAPIQIFIRDPISGTYLGFQELAMENKAYVSGTTMVTNYSGIVEAVAKDANAIGYSGMDIARLAGVKAISIGGIAPSAATVSKKQYPYCRPLRLYTNKKSESQGARDFIQFVQSPKGQAVLDSLGFVPHQ